MSKDISEYDVFRDYFPKRAPGEQYGGVSEPPMPTVDHLNTSSSWTYDVAGNKVRVREREKALGNTDIVGFAKRINDLLNDAWEDDWGDFTMEYPTGSNPDALESPVITFDIISRKPSKGKIGLKARPTEIFLDPEDPNHTIILHRKWFDCIGEFSFFHRTNKESRILMDRFEAFIDTYRGFFKDEGLSEIIFQEEINSKHGKKYIEGLPSTTLQYFIVIERILVEKVRTTKDILQSIKNSSI